MKLNYQYLPPSKQPKLLELMELSSETHPAYHSNAVKEGLRSMITWLSGSLSLNATKLAVPTGTAEQLSYCQGACPALGVSEML